MDYTVTLSEAENLALQYVAADPGEWIENAAITRARVAIDDICKKYMDYKFNNNEPINVGTKDEMVLAAFGEGIVYQATSSPVGIASTSL